MIFHAALFFIFMDLFYFSCKIRHRLGNFDFLRTYCFATFASNAGGGAFFFGDRRQCDGGKVAAPRIQVLVVKRKQAWNVKIFRASFGAVAAGGAGESLF